MMSDNAMKSIAKFGFNTYVHLKLKVEMCIY